LARQRKDPSDDHLKIYEAASEKTASFFFEIEPIYINYPSDYYSTISIILNGTLMIDS
jgi:hypothetical protein